MPARALQPAAPQKPVEVSLGRAAVVRWTVAREALAGRVGRVGADDVLLELSATPSPDGWACRACLVDGPALIPVETPPVGATAVGWTRDAETGLDHLDLPGFLHATLRGADVLYARTPILAALSVPGGRYEVV